MYWRNEKKNRSRSVRSYTSVNILVFLFEIWESYVQLFRGSDCLAFILTDSNARRNRDTLFCNLLESDDIRRMKWPVRLTDLTDLNPTEHACNALKWGGGSNWESFSTSQNHPRHGNSFVVNVVPTATWSLKLLDFKYEFTLW